MRTSGVGAASDRSADSARRARLLTGDLAIMDRNRREAAGADAVHGSPEGVEVSAPGEALFHGEGGGTGAGLKADDAAPAGTALRVGKEGIAFARSLIDSGAGSLDVPKTGGTGAGQ